VYRFEVFCIDGPVRIGVDGQNECGKVGSEGRSIRGITYAQERRCVGPSVLIETDRLNSFWKDACIDGIKQ
jgi:hypothetical protein